MLMWKSIIINDVPHVLAMSSALIARMPRTANCLEFSSKACGPQEDPSSPGKPFTRHPYHVRVLVPCYKESLDILRRTVMAAYDADLPEGCESTIYLLDDGKDSKKRKWVETLGPDVVYVSGRKREPGEMNGKSGNLNNVCSQLYPKGTPIPSTELLCIFDADQARSCQTPDPYPFAHPHFMSCMG